MKHVRRMARVMLSLVAILSLLPAANGQDLSGVIPGLKLFSQPDWVREGTRISYYSATADVPESYEKYILDEEGDWVGVKSGKNYRREEIFGAGGHGVTQVDVLSLEKGVAALKISSWLYSGMTGPLTPIKQGVQIAPAAGGDWYINPEALAELQVRRAGGITILRMPYEVNGVTYNAIRIQQDSDTSSFAHIYDTEDGKLLATFNSAESADKMSTVFSHATFLGIRQMNPPWLSQDLPEWMKRGKVLRYQGTRTYEAILARYSFPTAISLEMKISGLGQRYYTYDQKASISASGFPAQYGQDSQVGGTGEPGGLVLPPMALASLRADQVIDRDDITGIVVFVKSIGQDEEGRDLVVIRAANEVYSADVTYDISTGAMVGFSESKLGAESNEYTELWALRDQVG